MGPFRARGADAHGVAAAAGGGGTGGAVVATAGSRRGGGGDGGGGDGSSGGQSTRAVAPPLQGACCGSYITKRCLGGLAAWTTSSAPRYAPTRSSSSQSSFRSICVAPASTESTLQFERVDATTD
jgi:hypothetical protein